MCMFLSCERWVVASMCNIGIEWIFKRSSKNVKKMSPKYKMIGDQCFVSTESYLGYAKILKF